MKKTAILAAKEAGKILLNNFNKTIIVKNKKTTSNLVTEIDLKSERKIILIIKGKYPDHNFLAEEETKTKNKSEYLWVIDPIDGTNNYSHGFPHSCISIALYKNDQPKLGVVFDPFKNELFCAEKGKGAFLNNKKITVSKTKKLNQSLLCTGFYYERGALMKKTLKQMEFFFKKNVHGIRRTGSAALDLCYVAAGRFDGFWELKLSPWDFAAASLIVMEAGGKVTDINTETYSLRIKNILASNHKIHSQMHKVVSKK